MEANSVPPRYARQAVLKEIGAAGQERLAAATAVIVGLGALGSSSADLLARAGVGTLRLVDRDFVDWTNLQRQCLFEEQDAAERLPKAEAAVRYLKRVNSELRYEALTEDVNPGNVQRIVSGAGVVVDGLDNFYTRDLLNEACVKLGIPWIYGACLGTYGNAATIVPSVSACLNCLVPELGGATALPLTCETVGVFGPVAALVGSWQSSEALKILIGKSEAVSGDLIHVDVWRNDFSALPMTRNPSCRVCGQRRFELLEHGRPLATASLCGRDAVQIVPPPSFQMDFDLLCQTLERLFTLERNPYLIKFHVDDHDIVVFHDGRAMVFGTSDPKVAMSLYGKYVGG